MNRWSLACNVQLRNSVENDVDDVENLVGEKHHKKPFALLTGVIRFQHTNGLGLFCETVIRVKAFLMIS